MKKKGDQIGLPMRFGKYLLVELIAHGGMAEIFKAKSYGVSGFEKTIVIKRILPSYSDDREFVDMLIDEAKICAGLQHANIVQTFDLGRLEGRYYIAMEYVNGVDMVTMLSRLRKAKRKLPLELVCFILSEALNGLEHAHRAVGPDEQPLNIIHRDFNPANILLSYQGDVKVADFGIARATDRGTKTVAGGLKGKMGYLSPEQVADRPLDSRSDIFTAGITLWESLTCKRMYAGGTELDVLLAIRDAVIPDVREHVPEVDDEMINIMSRALQKKPEDRYRTAREFKDVLDDYLFDRGIKVSQSHLEGYLKHLFADRIDDAKRRSQTEKVEHTLRRPPRYWVRKTGQKTVGPVEMEKLSEMLVAGEIPQTSEVLREGGTWRSVKDVPELAVHLSKLPTAEESDPDAVASYQGLIAEVSFPKLFYRLAIAGEDGRLVLSRPGVKKEIYVSKGMPEFVKSDILSERLGEYLVDRKVVTEEQRDQAVQAMKGFSGRLGDTLIGLGMLQPHELFENLQSQVKEKILEVFSWSVGTYRFFAGQTYQGEVVPLKVGNYALIAEGVRQYTSMELLRNRYRPRMDVPIERVKNPYLELDKLALSAREQRVVDSIDGSRSIRDLLTLGGSDRSDFEASVYQILFILEELEMLRFKQ
jgi:eukaryotic-like serine/threonine-protein kinase